MWDAICDWAAHLPKYCVHPISIRGGLYISISAFLIKTVIQIVHLYIINTYPFEFQKNWGTPLYIPPQKSKISEWGREINQKQTDFGILDKEPKFDGFSLITWPHYNISIFLFLQ